MPNCYFGHGEMESPLTTIPLHIYSGDWFICIIFRFPRLPSSQIANNSQLFLHLNSLREKFFDSIDTSLEQLRGRERVTEESRRRSCPSLAIDTSSLFFTCVGGGHAHAVTYVWISEDNFQELVLFLYHVRLWELNPGQLGDKCLCLWSHFIHP